MLGEENVGIDTIPSDQKAWSDLLHAFFVLVKSKRSYYAQRGIGKALKLSRTCTRVYMSSIYIIL